MNGALKAWLVPMLLMAVLTVVGWQAFETRELRHVIKDNRDIAAESNAALDVRIRINSDSLAGQKEIQNALRNTLEALRITVERNERHQAKRQ